MPGCLVTVTLDRRHLAGCFDHAFYIPMGDVLEHVPTRRSAVAPMITATLVPAVDIDPRSYDRPVQRRQR